MQTALQPGPAENAIFAGPPTALSLGLKRRRRLGEILIQGFLFFSGALSILTTIGIVVVLVRESLRFFGSPEVSLGEFLTGTTWQPHIGEFGIWPLATSTLMTTGIAMLVAVPLGLCVAIYLSEYATERARSLLKPVLEVLAGVPTVVYGYFALTFMTPLLRSIFGRDAVEIYNMASGGIVMGVLILPLISSISEDALSAVPRVAARGIVCRRRHAAGNGRACGRPGGHLRHLGRPDPGVVARHRRDDDRRPGSGRRPCLDLQPLQGRRDDDRPHRAHQRRRSELRVDRL